jgi:hypothetical protein
VGVHLYGMPENFMTAVSTQYYMPNEIQSGLTLPLIPGTNYQDPVAALYSNQSMDPNDDIWDPYNLTVGNFSGISEIPLPEVKLLIPEGLREVLSVDTKTQARICKAYKNSPAGVCNKVYRIKVRGMITKVPGPFFYTSYRQVAFMKPALMTSIPQYKMILNDILDGDATMKSKF